MPFSRREFTIAAGSLVALTVLGCNRKEAPSNSSQTAATGDDAKHCDNEQKLIEKPFLAGPATKYAQAGVYSDYYKETGVFLVSDGAVLLAISSICPHQSMKVVWEQDKQQFVCLCHKSHFDKQGTQLADQKARRPMERCSIKLVETPEGKQVEVDPSTIFAKDKNKDEFGDPLASLKLG